MQNINIILIFVNNRLTLRKPWPFGPVPPCSAKVETKDSHDNFIAARLPGEWVFHRAITDFLKVNEDKDTEVSQDDVTLSFTDNPSILSEVTEDKCVFIAKTGRRVFAAGTFGIHSREHGNHLFPYVLIDHDGTSAIVYWPSSGPTAIPMLVQMAPGVKTEHDLLIIGEDRLGKPFGLLHRSNVAMPGMESAKVIEEKLPSLDNKGAAGGGAAEFDLMSFLAAQGAGLVPPSEWQGAALLPGGEEEQLLGIALAAAPQPEPEPMAAVLVEKKQPGDEKTFAQEQTLVVDPIVKMLVEHKDDDIQNSTVE